VTAISSATARAAWAGLGDRLAHALDDAWADDVDERRLGRDRRRLDRQLGIGERGASSISCGSRSDLRRGGRHTATGSAWVGTGAASIPASAANRSPTFVWRFDPYLQRKEAEGKTRMEAMRCLKSRPRPQVLSAARRPIKTPYRASGVPWRSLTVNHSPDEGEL
jgi:hypothetical protein